MTTKSQNNKDSWKIGMRRVNKIVEAEKNRGFDTEVTGIYSKMADIIVYTSGRRSVVRVYEVTNYKKPEFYVQNDRAERYLGNLLAYQDADKVFVCSYEENLRYLPGGRNYFEKHGIRVDVRNYQD